MSVEFNYHFLSMDLVDEWLRLLRRGSSLTVLGAQGCGKRFGLRLVRQAFIDDGDPFIYLEVNSSSPLAIESAIVDTFRDPAGLIVRGFSRSEEQPLRCANGLTSFLAQIESIANSHGRPVTLICTNVDALAEHHAFTFLSGIRRLVDQKFLVVALSGENNLRHLVHGPTSAFLCTNQYVIYGHDRPLFDKFVDKRLAITTLKVDRQVFKKRLYEVTNGQVKLARAVIHFITEDKIRYLHEPKDAEPIDADSVCDDFLLYRGRLLFGYHPYRYAVRAVRTDEDSWPHLENLLQMGQSPLPFGHDHPTTLELAGIAQRESDGKELRFSSPYADKFSHTWFTPQFLGDCYAGRHQWTDAWRCYREVERDLKIRPLLGSEHEVIRGIVARLSDRMHFIAAQRRDSEHIKNELLDLISNGLAHLLGHGQVWISDSRGFRPLHQETDDTAHQRSRAQRILLDSESRLPALPAPPLYLMEHKAFVNTSGIEGFSHTNIRILVTDLDLGAPVSRARQELTRSLLHQFSLSWSHVCYSSIARERLGRSMESAWNQLRDPVFVLDGNGHLRFANERFAKLANCTEGWFRANQIQRLSDISGCSGLSNALPTTVPTTVHATDVHSQMPGDWLVVGQKIEMDPPCRLFILRDRSIVGGVFDTLTKLVAATDVNEALGLLFRAIPKILRRRPDQAALKVRLYTTLEDDVTTMVSKHCEGMNENNANAFNNGQVILEAGLKQAWIAVEQKRPVMIFYDPSLDGETVNKSDTEEGLEYWIVGKFTYEKEVEKRPEDFWIDFPLFLGENLLGKLTISLGSERPMPEEFDYLSSLSLVLTDLLASLDNLRENEVNAAAQRSMALTAHTVGNLLARLPPLVELYKLESCEHPALGSINKILEEDVKDLFTTIRRVKDKLGDVVVKNEHLDLESLIKRGISVAGDHARTTVDIDANIQFCGDRDHLYRVFSELAENSWDFRNEKNGKLEIDVTVTKKISSQGNRLYIIYTDNGIGVEDFNRSKIFDHCFSDRRRTGSTGTGVGLWYVDRVIKAHGGSISLDQKQPSAGTRFVINLPYPTQNRMTVKKRENES